MARIRLLIVDDHEVVRLGLRAAFELEPDINVVGEASDGAEALAKMSVLAPQLILMDVRMERMSGIEACREIKSLYPDVSILMITSYTDNEAFLASMLAGASSYLLKNLSRAELLQPDTGWRANRARARSASVDSAWLYEQTNSQHPYCDGEDGPQPCQSYSGETWAGTPQRGGGVCG